MHHACASGSTEVLEWLTKNFEGEGVCTELLNQKSKVKRTAVLLLKLMTHNYYVTSVSVHSLIDCL